MNEIEAAKELIKEMNAGCSSFSWTTQEEQHIWGRNFDFNRIAQGSKVTFVPKGTSYYGCGTSMENNLEGSKITSDYAMIGMGSLLIPSTPVIYEGINEKGLMGGQLYYRNFAYLDTKVRQDTIAIQAPFVVTYLLSMCATVDEVVNAVKNEITILGKPMFGVVPTIHWTFTDRSGETIILEPDEGGMSIYRNTMGVMTNSPGYSWHRTNLLNYFTVGNTDIDTLEINGTKLEQCFSGNGSIGIPGDCSSPSRFVRLSFLKDYGVKGATEQEGIVNMMHMFDDVAFPLGLVKLSNPGGVTEHDVGVVPYDYTIYTSAMCSESLRYYWKTYGNPRIQCADLSKLLTQQDYVQYELTHSPDINQVN